MNNMATTSTISIKKEDTAKKTKSKVWNYFDKVQENDKDFTKCNVNQCIKKYAYNGNTSANKLTPLLPLTSYGG